MIYDFSNNRVLKNKIKNIKTDYVFSKLFTTFSARSSRILKIFREISEQESGQIELERVGGGGGGRISIY